MGRTLGGAGEARSVSPRACSDARSMGTGTPASGLEFDGGTGDVTGFPAPALPEIPVGEFPRHVGDQGDRDLAALRPRPGARGAGVDATHGRSRAGPSRARATPVGARAGAEARIGLPTERRLRSLALGAIVDVARETVPEGRSGAAPG